MGTTTATLYVRPSMRGYLSVDGRSAATMYVPLRAVTGLYSAGGIRAQDTKNLKRWKPQTSVPLVDDKGMITGPWNDFLGYIARKKLGGPNAHTLPQVESMITYGQAEALFSSLLGAALSNQVLANAQTLDAVRQVLVTAETPGAIQIPAVQLVPADTSAPINYTVGGDTGGGEGD